jgi:hypothetical protein
VDVKHEECHGTGVPGGLPLQLNASHCAQACCTHGTSLPPLARFYTPLTLLYTPFTPLTRLLNASYTSSAQPAALLSSTHFTLIYYSFYSHFLWFTSHVGLLGDRALSERCLRDRLCERERTWIKPA